MRDERPAARVFCVGSRFWGAILVCLDDSTHSFLSVKRRCAMCNVHVALDVVAVVAEAIHMTRHMQNEGVGAAQKN